MAFAIDRSARVGGTLIGAILHPFRKRARPRSFSGMQCISGTLCSPAACSLPITEAGASKRQATSLERPVAKKAKLLSDLFHDTLKDVYFAENKILKTLPKMAKAAQSKDLKAAFVKHERETRGQVKRLQGVFKIIGKPARAKTCDAILGITDEGAEIMQEYKGMPALDAGLLAAAQAVEHYEMSRYGTLRTWAEQLGLPDAVALLEATLKEEKATDAALTTLAKTIVNVEAEADL
jgi:ferritin-like metal-binding protein YciE